MADAFSGSADAGSADAGSASDDDDDDDDAAAFSSSSLAAAVREERPLPCPLSWLTRRTSDFGGHSASMRTPTQLGKRGMPSSVSSW